MKTPLKAALISALVFPGAGHLFLKKYTSGIILTSAFSLALYFLMIDLMSKAEYMIQQIETGNIRLELSSITEQLTNQSIGMSDQTSSLITFSIGLLWVVAILDAYRVGRIKNNK
jgi:hypothetical protein